MSGLIVSLGDAVNAIPMFQISVECYAVENAAEELKVMAGGIIPGNDDDGVALWLKEMYRSKTDRGLTDNFRYV